MRCRCDLLKSQPRDSLASWVPKVSYLRYPNLLGTLPMMAREQAFGRGGLHVGALVGSVVIHPSDIN